MPFWVPEAAWSPTIDSSSARECQQPAAKKSLAPLKTFKHKILSLLIPWIQNIAKDLAMILKVPFSYRHDVPVINSRLKYIATNTFPAAKKASVKTLQLIGLKHRNCISLHLCRTSTPKEFQHHAFPSGIKTVPSFTDSRGLKLAQVPGLARRWADETKWRASPGNVAPSPPMNYSTDSLDIDKIHKHLSVSAVMLPALAYHSCLGQPVASCLQLKTPVPSWRDPRKLHSWPKTSPKRQRFKPSNPIGTASREISGIFQTLGMSLRAFWALLHNRGSETFIFGCYIQLSSWKKCKWLEMGATVNTLCHYMHYEYIQSLDQGVQTVLTATIH